MSGYEYDYERLLDLAARIGNCAHRIDLHDRTAAGNKRAFDFSVQIATDVVELQEILRARQVAIVAAHVSPLMAGDADFDPIAMTYTEIREAADVTDAHIEEAADCREGLYGGVPLTWMETIDHVEGSNEDWGSDMSSPAIKELQRRTRLLLKEREG